MSMTTHPVHHPGDKHHLDREAMARMQSTVVFGLIGIGLALCALGAIAFDVVHLLGSW